jgi:hypothetical protein
LSSSEHSDEEDEKDHIVQKNRALLKVTAKPLANAPKQPAKLVAAKPVPAKPVAAKPVTVKPISAKQVPVKPVSVKPVSAAESGNKASSKPTLTASTSKKQPAASKKNQKKVSSDDEDDDDDDGDDDDEDDDEDEDHDDEEYDDLNAGKRSRYKTASLSTSAISRLVSSKNDRKTAESVVAVSRNGAADKLTTAATPPATSMLLAEVELRRNFVALKSDKVLEKKCRILQDHIDGLSCSICFILSSPTYFILLIVHR